MRTGMSKETIRRVKELVKEFPDGFSIIYPGYTFDDMGNGQSPFFNSPNRVTLETLTKYGLLDLVYKGERVEVVETYTVPEFVDFVNGLIGEDLYGMDSEFRAKGDTIEEIKRKPYHSYKFTDKVNELE